MIALMFFLYICQTRGVNFVITKNIVYVVGHELAFIAFLLCFYKIGVLTQTDAEGLVLKVFDR